MDAIKPGQGEGLPLHSQTQTIDTAETKGIVKSKTVATRKCAVRLFIESRCCEAGKGAVCGVSGGHQVA